MENSCFQEFKKTFILTSEIDDEDIPPAQQHSPFLKKRERSHKN
jgi:hypothetical protein